jgi:hypothetical protein
MLSAAESTEHRLWLANGGCRKIEVCARIPSR